MGENKAKHFKVIPNMNLLGQILDDYKDGIKERFIWDEVNEIADRVVSSYSKEEAIKDIKLLFKEEQK